MGWRKSEDGIHPAKTKLLVRHPSFHRAAERLPKPQYAADHDNDTEHGNCNENDNGDDNVNDHINDRESGHGNDIVIDHHGDKHVNDDNDASESDNGNDFINPADLRSWRSRAASF